jgi:hypothetical protein
VKYLLTFLVHTLHTSISWLRLDLAILYASASVRIIPVLLSGYTVNTGYPCLRTVSLTYICFNLAVWYYTSYTRFYEKNGML